VFTGLVKIVAEQGMADAIVQRAEIDTEHLDTAFWASLVLGGFAAAMIAATSNLVAGILGQSRIGPILAWLSVGVFISGLGAVPKAILSRKLAFSSLTVRSLLSVGLGGVAGVAAALAGLGVWALVVQSIVTELVAVITVWAIVDWRPRFKFSGWRFRALIGFGANVVGFRVLLFLKRRSDNLLVGSYLGVAALGFYSVAYRLLRILVNTTTSIVGVVAFPVLSRIQDEPERIREAYYRAIRYTSLIAFPAFLGLIVIAPEATRVAFGSEWDRSIPVMRVLALTGLLQSVTFINGTAMKALGKPSWRLGIVALEAAGSIIGFVIAVRWGIVAVAAALAIANYALAPVSLFATNKLIGLEARRYVESLRAPLAASVAMAAAVAALKGPTADLNLVTQVVLLVATGIVTYLGLLLVFARPVATDFIEIAKLALPSRGKSAPIRTSAPETDPEEI
jgi:PST family polysaccharide transporter